ncbi:sensor histidine kinase [Catenovulum sediminis]|uniref:sensor histidine kinase n=1 Tax=Catenovulum sediminis TaxID=1740262 RepID=UPI0011804F77|nr:HAMP domain-containing sensor histidine kinase [Catenovulum sediminis]
MFRSLANQLALIIGLLFLAATAVLFQWYLHSSEQFTHEVEQKLHQELAHHLIHDSPSLQQGIIEIAALKPVFHTQMLLGPEWEFYATDADGNILAYSAPEGVVKLNKINLQPIKNFINGANFPLYGDDPRTPGGHKIFSAAPILTPNGALSGYLYVIIGGQKLDNTIALLADSKVLKDSLVILALTILFGLLAMFLAIHTVTKPLKKLSQRTSSYVQNDFAHLQSDDKPLCAAKEIQELERSFSQSAKHIKHQLSQIKSTEQLRRELLSHVSHDFRTPLTALNGYLETWLISPTDKRSDELIKIALKNGQQISQLVEALFELARLESGDIKLYPEPVNLVELAHDVMQRLSFQAEQAKISLKLEHPQNNYPIARADIAKLERILVNLIDNAIRHSQANDVVTLAIVPQKENICISVQDTGTGIPKNELQAIFEAKYRATNSRGKNHHAGLGLAIVRHLLNMHNSDIQVSSEAQKGTCFSFALAYA